MPDKLTDKEIVNALEICGTYKGKCTDCPAFVKVDRSNCKNVLLGAVEIINRQKEDLAKKDKELLEALKYSAIYKTKVIDSEKEINRLQAKSKNKTAEIEELKTEINMFRGYDEEIKAEAYKEFAERLKERKYLDSGWSHGEHPYVVEESDIDEVLEELVGE